MSRKNTFAVGAMLFVAVMLSIRLWAGDERQELYSLVQVEQAPDGRVYVVLGDRLFIEHPDGTADRMIPLARLGIHEFHGDLAVLSDGSVIVARGQMPATTLEESALATAGLATAENTPSDTLMRCSLDTFDCTPLDGAGTPARLGRTFMLAVDEQLARIVVTDTSRNRLLLLDYDGRVLARDMKSFRFPNQVQHMGDGEVVVADSWHRRFVAVDYGGDRFGEPEVIATTDCWPASAVRASPTGFQQLPGGSRWAVSGLDLDIGGGLYRLDAECATAVETAPNSDLLFLAAAGDTILAPDAEHFRIWRFDAYGTPLPDFGSPELSAELERQRFRKRWITFAFDWSLWLLLGAAVPMILVGRRISQEDEAISATGDAVDPAEMPTADADGDRPAPTTAATPSAYKVLTPAEQLQHLRGEYLFRRRILPVNSDDAFRLFSAMALVAYAAWFGYLWLIVRATEHQGVATLMLHENTFVAMTAVALLTSLGSWLALRNERLHIDRNGIRYRSFLSGPLRFLNGLQPDWDIRWQDIARIELCATGNGKKPQQWVFTIREREGNDRVVKALYWGINGHADGGLDWSWIGAGSRELYAAGAMDTWLYRLLAFRGSNEEARRAAAVAEARAAMAGPIPQHYYEAFVGPVFEKYWRRWERAKFMPWAPSFNFAALFFGIFWLGLRRMYLWVAIVAVIVCSAAVVQQVLLPDAIVNYVNGPLAMLAFLFGNGVYLAVANDRIRRVTAVVDDEETRLAVLAQLGGRRASGAFVALAIMIAVSTPFVALLASIR